VVGRTNTTIKNPCDFINDLEATQMVAALNVFPNPANNVLMISGAALKADIYDLFGRLVLSVALNAKYDQIDISGLNKGAYLLIIQGDDLLKNQLFIKQ
jgi:hypothetical protein